MPSKKVLIIAGEFPPIKTIGRLRTVKFAQHLQSFGWVPIILTLETSAENHDISLENEIPADIEIYRVAKPDIERSIVHKIKSILRKTPQTAGGNKVHVSQSSAPTINKGTLKDWAINLFKQTLKYLIYIPDDFNIWAIEAEKKANYICSQHDIDLIYTTLPPFSSCHVGYKIKSKHNIPWVVDYRDLWYGDVLREWIPPFRQKIELLMEKRYMRKADAIISVSEQKTAYLKTFHTKTYAIWETITNGYDNEIFEPLLAQPRQINEYINFVYTGRLFKNRKGYAFAEALGQLCQESPDLKNRVRVHILGGVSPEIQIKYDEILLQYDIKELYIFTGDISYQQAMLAQVNADYLLLIVDTGSTSDGVIPGKLFEYIASRRPIFALTDPGATQEIIEKSRVGIVVPAESTEHCKNGLRELLQKTIPVTCQADQAYLEQFDRKVLSARLAKLFDQLVNN